MPHKRSDFIQEFNSRSGERRATQTQRTALPLPPEEEVTLTPEFLPEEAAPGTIDVRDPQPASRPPTFIGGEFQDPFGTPEGGGSIILNGESATLLPSGEIVMDGKTFGADENFGVGFGQPSKSLDTSLGGASFIHLGELNAEESLLVNTTLNSINELETTKKRNQVQLGIDTIRKRNELGDQSAEARRVKKRAKKLRRSVGTFGGSREEQADRTRTQRFADKMFLEADAVFQETGDALANLRSDVSREMLEVEDTFAQEQQNLLTTAQLKIQAGREAAGATTASKSIAAQGRIAERNIGRLESQLKTAVKTSVQGRGDLDIRVDIENPSQIFIVDKKTGQEVTEQEFFEEGLDLDPEKESFFGFRPSAEAIGEGRGTKKIRERRLRQVQSLSGKLTKELQKLDSIQILTLSGGGPVEGFEGSGGDITQEWLEAVRRFRDAHSVDTQTAIGLIRQKIAQFEAAKGGGG